MFTARSASGTPPSAPRLRVHCGLTSPWQQSPWIPAGLQHSSSAGRHSRIRSFQFGLVLATPRLAFGDANLRKRLPELGGAWGGGGAAGGRWERASPRPCAREEVRGQGQAQPGCGFQAGQVGPKVIGAYLVRSDVSIKVRVICRPLRVSRLLDFNASIIRSLFEFYGWKTAFPLDDTQISTVRVLATLLPLIPEIPP